MFMTKEKSLNDSDAEAIRIIEQARVSTRPELIQSIEKRLSKYADKKIKPIRFGKFYAFMIHLENLPPRIIISPLPYSKSFIFTERDVITRGWFGPADTTKAVVKLVGAVEVEGFERRIGAYLLLMSEGLVKYGIRPSDIADELTEEKLSRPIEQYSPYLNLRLQLRLQEIKTSLREYEGGDMYYEDYKEWGERLFRELANTVSEALDATFTLYNQLKRGKLNWLPTWNDIKKYGPWIILIIVIIAITLYFLNIIMNASGSRRMLIDLLKMLW